MTSGFVNAIAANQFVLCEDDVLLGHWQQFVMAYPSENACMQELYRRFEEQGFIKCHHCGDCNIEKDHRSRSFRCNGCQKISWFTAKTFFHRIRKARPWLAAIWFMERGIILSSSRFHRLVGIAYSSALNIFRKLASLISKELKADVLDVSSKEFLPIIGKRSRETPAAAPPFAEQKELDRLLMEDSQESVDVSELPADQREVYEVLSSSPVSFDILCHRLDKKAGHMSAMLTMLELAGFAERLIGDNYVRCLPDKNMAITGSNCVKEIQRVMSFICLHFHRISRKYLQYYLALFWCHKDTKRWGSGSLFNHCLRSKPVFYRQILNYISPPVVRMAR